MKKSNIMGSINSIESFGLVDGPGIRTVVFLNGCKLRCLYCHNPETWKVNDNDIKITPEGFVEKVKRYVPYYEKEGGVTFSGGEPLLQSEFLLSTLKLLKEEGIHTAIDTAGVGNGDYEEILEYVDLVILDVKATNDKLYKYITSRDISETLKFIEVCNKLDKKMWIRQVIVPGINDTKENVLELNEFLKQIKNVEKVELLPYHTLGNEKYKKLGIPYPLEDVKDMHESKIKELSTYLKY